MIDQEVEIGLRSISVPLLDIRGRTVAVINAGVAATQVGMADLVERFLPALNRVATEAKVILR